MNETTKQRMRADEARAGLARAIVAYAWDVPEPELAAATRRNAQTAFGRQIAMYLAHVAFELSLSRVALAFGRDRTTVSHACHKIEDCRDDPHLDARLDDLERMLRDLPDPGCVQVAA